MKQNLVKEEKIVKKAMYLYTKELTNWEHSITPIPVLLQFIQICMVLIIVTPLIAWDRSGGTSSWIFRVGRWSCTARWILRIWCCLKRKLSTLQNCVTYRVCAVVYMILSALETQSPKQRSNHTSYWGIRQYLLCKINRYGK